MSRRIVPLKSINFASGGRAIVELDQLPGGHYLNGLLFNLPINFVAPAAAQAAVLPRTFDRVLDLVKCGRRWNVTGAAINALNWVMSGYDNSATDYIVANANGVLDRTVNLFLPLSDFNAYEPDDTAPAVEVLKDTPLELGMGSLAALFPGMTTITPGILQTYAVCMRGAPGKQSTPVMLDIFDLTPDSRIDPGVYSHLAMFKEDGTNITATELGNLTLYVDGTPILDAISISALAALFNATKSKGAQPSATAITTPFLAIPGEGITEEPGGAVGAGAVVSSELVPLIYPHQNGKLTKCVVAPNGLRIRWTGNAAGLRVVARRVEPLSDSQVIKAGSKMGLGTATVLTTKTASKAPVDPDSLAGRLLPRRLSNWLK